MAGTRRYRWQTLARFEGDGMASSWVDLIQVTRTTGGAFRLRLVSDGDGHFFERYRSGLFRTPQWFLRFLNDPPGAVANRIETFEEFEVREMIAKWARLSRPFAKALSALHQVSLKKAALRDEWEAAAFRRGQTHTAGRLE